MLLWIFCTQISVIRPEEKCRKDGVGIDDLLIVDCLIPNQLYRACRVAIEPPGVYIILGTEITNDFKIISPVDDVALPLELVCELRNPSASSVAPGHLGKGVADADDAGKTHFEH
jgi:hypothetical protein